jgi:alkylhydroperoxidase family enzyme
VDQELYQRLRESFSERALLELATAITWKNYLARLNRLYAVNDPGTFAPKPEV